MKKLKHIIFASLFCLVSAFFVLVLINLTPAKTSAGSTPPKNGGLPYAMTFQFIENGTKIRVTPNVGGNTTKYVMTLNIDFGNYNNENAYDICSPTDICNFIWGIGSNGPSAASDNFAILDGPNADSNGPHGNGMYYSSAAWNWNDPTCGPTLGADACDKNGKIQISGGVSNSWSVSGATTWYGGTSPKYGTELYTSPPSPGPQDGFEFLSPFVIFDKNTGEYYENDGGHNPFQNGGNRFMSDGDFLYWPVGQKEIAASDVQASVISTPQNVGQCWGGLAVKNDGPSYGDLYLVPSFDIKISGQDNCYFGNPSNQAPYPVGLTDPSHYDTSTGGLPFPVNGGSSDSGMDVPGNQFSNSTSPQSYYQSRQMYFSTLGWKDPGDIGVMGRAATLTQITATADSQLYGLIQANLKGMLPPGVTSGPNTEFFTTSQCINNSKLDPSFIMVNYDSNKSLTDESINSSNAIGYIYIGGDNGSGWLNQWATGPGTGVNCLYSNASQDNSYYGGGIQPAETYISGLAASVGNSSPQTPPITSPNPNGQCNTQVGSDCQAIITCNTTWSNPLTWLICPIVSGVQDLMNQVGAVITSNLTIPPNYFNNTAKGTGQPLYIAWNSIRILAIAALLIVAIIMVFSQAVSAGPFDAYTVKKLLPRILIAAIAVTLSWQLVGLAVAISNSLGESIRTIMFAPFQNIGNINATSGSLGFSLVAGSALGVALGIFGILSFGVTAALALVVGLAVIILRQIVVIVLAIFVPLAIVMAIFPGTKKAWDVWWDGFSGALLLFPIIEAFIAAGSIFAVISVNELGRPNNGGTATFTPIIAFIAIYLPYFLLPATVRFAGGALRAIGGQIGTAHDGIRKRLSSFRQNQLSKNAQNLQRGTRFSGQRWIPGSQTLADRANAISAGIGTGWKGHFGVGTRGSLRAGGLLQTNAEQYAKDHPDFAKTLVAQDDTAAVMGLSGGTAAGAVRAADDLRRRWEAAAIASGVDPTQAAARAAERSRIALESARGLGVNRVAATAALGIMSQNKSRAIGDGDYEIVQEGIARLSGGNDQLAQDLAYNYQYNSRQAQRVDLGGDWTSAGVRDIQGPSIAALAAANPGLNQAQLITMQQAQQQELRRRAVYMDSVARTDPRVLVGGYQSVRQARHIINEDFASGDVQRMAEASSLVTELFNHRSSASGDNRNQLDTLFGELGISTAGNLGSVEDQLVERINNTPGLLAPITVQQLRSYARTYSSPEQQYGAGGGGAGGAGGGP